MERDISMGCVGAVFWRAVLLVWAELRDHDVFTVGICMWEFVGVFLVCPATVTRLVTFSRSTSATVQLVMTAQA